MDGTLPPDLSRLPPDAFGDHVVSARGEDATAGAAVLADAMARGDEDQRWAVLSALMDAGFSPEDEPVLEACLDDPSWRVQEGARLMLDWIPGSRRAGRLAEQVSDAASVSKAGKVRLSMSYPWNVRDVGVEGKASWSAREALERAVKGAGWEIWTQVTGAPVEDLPDRISGPPHLKTVIGNAAAYPGHRALARRYLETLPTDESDERETGWYHAVGPSAAPALAAQRARVLREEGKNAMPVLLVGALGWDWDLVLSEQLLELARWSGLAETSTMLDRHEAHAHPGLVTSVDTWRSEEQDEALCARLGRLSRCLRLRLDVLEAFGLEDDAGVWGHRGA